MTTLPATVEAQSLPAFVSRAERALANARTAIEVLEARELARVAISEIDAELRKARMKGAHDDLIRAAHELMQNAMGIEAQAKVRLAQEYDAAKERGEVAGHGAPPGGRGNQYVGGKIGDSNLTTISALGLTAPELSEGRAIAAAEAADPGIVDRTLSAQVSAGEKPTRAAVTEAVKATNAKGKPAKEAKPDRPDKGKKKDGTPRKIAESLAPELRAKFGDGEWYRLDDMTEYFSARYVDAGGNPVTDKAVVGTIQNAAKLGTISFDEKLVGIDRASGRDSTTCYRMFRLTDGEKVVSLKELTTKLEPIIENLAEQGKCSQVTISPPSVARCSMQLRKLLSEWAE